MVVDALPYESEDAVAEREVKMPVQQIAFDIPPLIASKLLTGEYIQWGGIVRDQAGRIVKHLKPVQIEQAGEQAMNVATFIACSPACSICTGFRCLTILPAWSRTMPPHWMYSPVSSFEAIRGGISNAIC